MATKILAIDDSKTMRLAIKITFAAEDAEVTSVSRGSDAVPRIKAKDGGYDVVLVDAQLAAGEPSGYDVCRAIKQDASTAQVPVVLLVSNQTGVDEAQLAAAGGDDWLAKPFTTDDLIAKVEGVIAAGSRPAAAAKPVAAATAPAVAAPAVAPPAAARPPTGSQPAVPRARTGSQPAVPRPPTGSQPAVARTPTGPQPAARPPRARTGSQPAVASAAPSTATRSRRAVNRTQMGMPSPGVAASGPAAAKPAVAPPPGAPVATAPPVRTPPPSTPTPAVATPVTAAPSDGAIPIAIPIPFTAADSPTPGMVERLQQAAGNAGVDPQVAAALAALSREVVERIVWEVVPELAESIIREHQAKSA
ncbi:MAG: response regulator [Nannocystaceae bacterium]